MTHRPVAVVRQRKLALLQLRVGEHAVRCIRLRQLEHGEVQRVEAGQRDELEHVAHIGKAALERCDVLVAQLGFPVEGRRAVVGQQLARELRVDRLGKLFRFGEVWLRRLAPDQVAMRRIRQAAGDRNIGCLRESCGSLQSSFRP